MKASTILMVAVIVLAIAVGVWYLANNLASVNKSDYDKGYSAGLQAGKAEACSKAKFERLQDSLTEYRKKLKSCQADFSQYKTNQRYEWEKIQEESAKWRVLVKDLNKSIWDLNKGFADCN